MTMTDRGSATGAPAKGSGASKGRGSLGALALIGTGTFLITAGLIAMIYLPGQLKLAPTDTDEVTELSGTALLPANFSDPSNLEQAPVRVFQTDRADGKASDGKVVVYYTFQCLVLDKDDIKGCVSSDDGRLVNAVEDHFATDRKTGESVNDKKYVGADAVPHEGLVNKFPFDSEKKTYKIWDGTVGAAVDAKYVDTEKVNGLEVYKYETSVNAEDVTILPDIQGSYVDKGTYYVEPKTGSIVNRADDQERFIDGKDLVLDLQVQMTDKEVAQKVDDAKSSLSALTLITKTIPLIAYPVGLILIGLGVFLRRRKANA